jgi:hypothetical protein
MLYTHLGRIVAVLVLLFGILLIVTGLGIANEWLLPYEAALTRYAPWARSSGEVITRGTYYVLFAIALGILTEISRSLRGITTEDTAQTAPKRPEN